MTSELPVTVDILRAALTSPTVQSPASATALYEALELEMGFHKFRVFGTSKFQLPAIPNEDSSPPHRTLREVMSRKELEEFAEEYYLRRTLTNISFEKPPRVSLPPVVHGSTNMGTVRESMSRNFLDYFQNTPISTPRPLHISVDMLAIALRSLGLENEISAIDFFHILEMELRERGIFPDVGVSNVPEGPPMSVSPPTEEPTDPSSRPPRFTDEQRCRVREAGKNYGRWLAAHPWYWSRPPRMPHHADEMNEATEQKFESQ